MATITSPFIYRDMSGGRFASSRVSPYLSPQSSVKSSINVNFDTIIGSSVVRNGTTNLLVYTPTVKWSDWSSFVWTDKMTTTWFDLIGTGTPTSPVASGKRPLGLASFVNKSSNINLLLSVFQGTDTASLYYFDTSWHTSDLVSTTNASKFRFTTFGGSAFVTNDTDGMSSSTNGSHWVSGASNNCIPYPISPSLIYRYGQRLLASGDLQNPSRVYFSSIIDPQASPFITWNTGADGDWIDINPDDGGYITGFSLSSTFLIVFKNTGMYRLDTINKTVNPDNIFDVGAISQEAVASCQGITYFYSGTGIYRTNGGYPELISRTGFQDVIDAVPMSFWNHVSLGSDGFNVFASVGNVILEPYKNTQKGITNCVGKFSVRDQNWSVHSYAQQFWFFDVFSDLTGQYMREADTSGNVQTVDYGTVDHSETPIYYELETQDIDFGNRSHKYQISNRITVFNNFGIDSSFQVRSDGSINIKDVPVDLSERVNISQDINLIGHFFNFRWYGESTGTAPIFEGFQIERITDVGNI